MLWRFHSKLSRDCTRQASGSHPGMYENTDTDSYLAKLTKITPDNSPLSGTIIASLMESSIDAAASHSFSYLQTSFVVILRNGTGILTGILSWTLSFSAMAITARFALTSKMITFTRSMDHASVISPLLHSPKRPPLSPRTLSLPWIRLQANLQRHVSRVQDRSQSHQSQRLDHNKLLGTWWHHRML